MLGVTIADRLADLPPRNRPGEWLEYSPLLTIAIAVLAAASLLFEFADRGALLAISNLNTYNFIFLMLGLLVN